MAIDVKTLKKLEPLPAAVGAESLSDDSRLVVLVKLRKGARPPSYLAARARMGDQIFSAEISARDLARVEADPSVESVSVSRKLQLID